MKCINCGKEIGIARVCWKCHARQPEGGEESTAPEESGAHVVEGSEQRRFCRACGAGLNEDGVCPVCEAVQGESSLQDKRAVVSKAADERGRRRRVILMSLGTAAALICAIVGVTWYGIDTAVHWEKVDDPGIMVNRATGYYNVSMTDEQVCYVGQDWTECINAYISEYNRECTKPMPSESVGAFNSAEPVDAGKHLRRAAHRVGPGVNQGLCERYSEMIDDMQAQDGGPGFYVSTLGSWGKLRSTPDTERVRVGYESHEAVCYYGFLGECPDEDEEE